MAATTLPDLLDPRLEVGVTLFGFPGVMTVPRAWDTGRQVLDEHMVYFIQRGSVLLHSGSDHFLRAAGGCALIPNGVPFQMSTSGAARTTLMRCRLVIGRGGKPVPCARAALVRQSAWELEPVMAMLVDEFGTPSRSLATRVRCLATLLLIGLAGGDPATVGLDARHRRALAELVDRHRAHGLVPRDLATHLGLTLDYFTRRFRLAYGIPPRRWLVQERIRAACVLLAEGESSLEAVAQALGYADAKLLGRQFRAVMGMPPGRWRARRSAAG